MQKLVFLLISIFLLQAAKAQNTGLYGGVAVGGNNVWVSHSNPFWSTIPYNGYTVHLSTNNRFVGALGADLGYAFNPHVSLVTELNYASMGNVFSDSTVQGVAARTLKSSYLQIPLLLKLTSGHEGTGFFVALGPHMGMLQKAMLSETVGANSTEYDITNKLNAKEYGLNASLGISIKVKSHLALDFGFKGVFGFTDINSPNIVYTNNYVPSVSKNGSVGIRLAAHYFIREW